MAERETFHVINTGGIIKFFSVLSQKTGRREDLLQFEIRESLKPGPETEASVIEAFASSGREEESYDEESVEFCQ